MKKLILIAAPLCLATSAHAVNLAYWNFNTNTTGTNNGASYSPTSGTASLNLVGWTTTGTSGITSFGGTTLNALNSDAAGQALALQGGTTTGTPNNGATMVLNFSTSGFEDVILSFATQRTSTGFNSNQVEYSTDGTNYTAFGSPYVPASSFSVQTFDLSAISAIENQSNVWIKVTFGGASANTGNNRIDNIQVNATEVVPEPATMTILAGAAAMAAMRRRKK